MGGVLVLKHVDKSLDGPCGVAADVVQPCVELLWVLPLPVAHLLGNPKGLGERRKLYPARLSVLHLLVSLLLILCPRVARATTPTEWYQDLAETAGVLVDLGADVWQDRSKEAYLQYILDNTNVNEIFSFYRSGQALEDLTGYNVVTYRDGKYYLNSCDDGSGGAFYEIDVSNPANFAEASKEYAAWLRYAVDNGPEWPIVSSGGSSGEGGLSGNVITLVANKPDSYSKVQNYEFLPFSRPYCATCQITLAETLGNSIQQSFNDGYLYLYAFNNGPNYSYIYMTDKPLTAVTKVYTEYDSNIEYVSSLRNDNESTVNGRYVMFRQTGTVEDGIWKVSTPSNATLSNITFVSGNILDIDNIAMYITFAASNGGETEGNDTPPSSTPERPVIQWPDITLPSLPSFTITNNYPTTASDIDFSPITTRLDAINENLEKFYDSFNLYWSDFMQYWDAMGDALENLQNLSFDANQNLRDIIAWLKNIFYHMGNGGSNPNVNVDPETGLRWYEKLLEKLLNALPDGLQELIATLAQLRAVFPFSIPWDLGLMLTGLAADPVAPVVDLPLPYAPNRTYMVHIDCTSWEPAAVMWRRAFVFLFGGWLAWNTKKLLGLVEI